jgi:hypothetical protein
MGIYKCLHVDIADAVRAKTEEVCKAALGRKLSGYAMRKAKADRADLEFLVSSVQGYSDVLLIEAWDSLIRCATGPGRVMSDRPKSARLRGHELRIPRCAAELAARWADEHGMGQS